MRKRRVAWAGEGGSRGPAGRGSGDATVTIGYSVTDVWCDRQCAAVLAVYSRWTARCVESERMSCCVVSRRAARLDHASWKMDEFVRDVVKST